MTEEAIAGGIIAHTRGQSENRLAPNSPEQIALQQLREKVSGSNEPLHTLASVELQAPPVADRERALESIFTSYDHTGKERRATTDERDTLRSAQDINEAAEAILRGSEAQKRAAVTGPVLHNALESVIRQNPVLWQRYQGMSSGDRTDYLVGLVSKGKVQEILHGKFANLFSKEKITALLDNTVQAQAEAEQARNLLPQLEVQRQHQEQQVQIQQRNMADYLDLPGQPRGKFAVDLENYRVQKAPHQTQVETLTKEIPDYERRRNNLDAALRTVSTSRPTIPGTIDGVHYPDATAASTARNNLNTEITTRNATLQKESQEVNRLDSLINTITARQDKIQTDINNARTELNNINEKINQARLDAATKTANAENKIRERVASLRQMLADMNASIGFAAISGLQEDLTKFIQVQKNIDEEAKKRAKGELSGAVTDRISNAFYRRNGKVNWKQFRKTFKSAVRLGEDQALMRLVGPQERARLQQLRAQHQADPKSAQGQEYESLRNQFHEKLQTLMTLQPRVTDSFSSIYKAIGARSFKQLSLEELTALAARYGTDLEMAEKMQSDREAYNQKRIEIHSKRKIKFKPKKLPKPEKLQKVKKEEKAA